MFTLNLRKTKDTNIKKQPDTTAETTYSFFFFLNHVFSEEVKTSVAWEFNKEPSEKNAFNFEIHETKPDS